MRLVQHIVSISIHTPLAGSDGTARPWSRPCGNFNPHSPCGERPCWNIRPNAGSYFNPHSPCEERLKPDLSVLKDMQFQSTLPLRGATSEAVRYELAKLISIHTPLAGSDAQLGGHIVGHYEISIHTPLAGSDILVLDFAVRADISIHTPLAGSDLLHAPCPAHRKYFNPHSPCGERRYGKAVEQTVWEFQSTLPLRGATWYVCVQLVVAGLVTMIFRV